MWLEGGFGVALVWLWCGLGVALVWPWCGFRVALGWLWVPNWLPSKWLCCGFEVALYSGVYAEYMPTIWLCGGLGWLWGGFRGQDTFARVRIQTHYEICRHDGVQCRALRNDDTASCAAEEIDWRKSNFITSAPASLPAKPRLARRNSQI